MVVSVTGATGTLGRAVIHALHEAGHQARVLSRRAAPPMRAERRRPSSPEASWFTVDLATGEGLVPALDGAYAVIHAASDPRQPEAVDLFGTQTVLEAAHRVGVRHLILISIVGVDRIPSKYYRAKHVAEQIVEAGSLRYSILRCTQFHPFLDQQFSALARVPFVFPVPRSFQIQSVDTREAADRLVRAIEDGPRGRLPDFGGPDVLTLDTAAELWVAARGISKRVVAVPIPGGLARAFREGHNVAPNGARGRITWTEWLGTHPAPEP
jgi:uncharacterized protein YbjT (DUF2867 family)